LKKERKKEREREREKEREDIIQILRLFYAFLS